jgi:hypothetical protein
MNDDNDETSMQSNVTRLHADDTVTNEMRAKWAEKALIVFQNLTGSDRDTAIADLIANLCHLAKQYKQDPLEQVRYALRMWANERDFPPDGWPPDGAVEAQVTVCVEHQK